ncbi:diguanylate cyclase domain-containing protein [Actinoplanes sp. NPDC049265]|uniref:diguanylate cyclase domain-containing protein n=1 Tax=Actinoplanes sp. NPDC049265 TaxID=3363902 RepID=UPI003722A2FB
MTVGSGVLPAGPAIGPPAPQPQHAPEPQVAMLTDLVNFMTRDTPSIGPLVDVVHEHLGACGLDHITIFALDPEEGTLGVVAGPADDREDGALAFRVFRAPAGGAPLRDRDRLGVRLRAGGQTVGVLVLAGGDLAEIRPYVISALALHVATTLQALDAERRRQMVANVTAATRRLFEEGTFTASVEEAGRVLAETVAAAFRTEHAALTLIDNEGRIVRAVGVGMAEEQAEAIRSSAVGEPAIASPLWSEVIKNAGPVLVSDLTDARTRAGGLARTMRLRSCVAIPLMAGTQPVGMVICGDSSRRRNWTGHDRTLARQLAVEGALIVDSARMRQAEAAHVETLTHQAFHDALTGLPNRSHLLDRADQAIAAALESGDQLALLLLDLNGFKQVNDTAGHHAGDVLLHQVGQRLQSALRGDDLVARLGGDEFAVLLTRNANEDRAFMVAERIHERLCEPYHVDTQQIVVGASIGIALFPDYAPRMPDLLRGADAAMYRAKRHGGGVRLAR